MEFKHLMVDIETMGNESFSSIISIGAVEFDIDTGETGKRFYELIDLQSCLDIGLKVNASTIMWWMKQNEVARLELANGIGLPIIEVLNSFSQFCSTTYQIWGNSARFDLGILQNAYNKLNITIPWDFRKERCLRTIVSFNPESKSNNRNSGTEHNPIDDCLTQIKYCSIIWNKLKSN